MKIFKIHAYIGNGNTFVKFVKVPTVVSALTYLIELGNTHEFKVWKNYYGDKIEDFNIMQIKNLRIEECHEDLDKIRLWRNMETGEVNE